jgi:hypothetical protein
LAYVPQFDFDIFVSYRHASNEGDDPWVDAFCDQLHHLLAEFSGDISIWRDSAVLRAGDRWRPEIAHALERAAIFLAIISRTYFDSDVCRTELDSFLGQRRSDTATGNIRIVPVFKQPPKEDQDLPRELAEIHHHEFYELKPPGSRRFREFSPASESTASQFLETMSQLAQDLGFALDELRERARRSTVGTVYLSRVGPELYAERAKLRGDLQQRGYLVVPETEYFWNAMEFRERITEDLGAAHLCIHLVSRTPSIDPLTADRARVQLDLATTIMNEQGKPLPLVWIQPAAETAAEAQALIDYIERDAANRGVEYLPGTLEDFKTQVYEKLDRRPAPTPTVKAKARDLGLICQDSDLLAMDELVGFLTDTLGLGLRRVKCAAAGPVNAEALAAALAHCDRAIVFWGTQPEEWVTDLLSLDALGNHANRKQLCVFTAAPLSPEKATYRTGKATTIHMTSPRREAELRAFLALDQS